MRRVLNLNPRSFTLLHTLLLCNPNITTTEELTTVAVLNYALYTGLNHLRHNPQNAQFDYHTTSTGILDSRWNMNTTRTDLPGIPTHI